MKADHPIGRPFDFAGGPHGVLLLHGFTGTPGHMRFIGENLRDKGYTVSAPILSGHGTQLSNLYSASWKKWLEEARMAYIKLRERCEKVTVAGLSMGGTLALILAEEYPVDGLICLSAAIRLHSGFSWAAPIVIRMHPYMMHTDTEMDKKYDMLSEHDAGYEGMATGRIHDLRKLISLADKNLYAVVAPTLIVQPVNDRTVDARSAERIFSGITASDKEILWLRQSRHVCTIGPEREKVLTAILMHLEKIG